MAFVLIIYLITPMKLISKIAESHGKADLLIVRHVLEHSWNIDEFLDALKVLVSKNGLIVLKFQILRKD